MQAPLQNAGLFPVAAPGCALFQVAATPARRSAAQRRCPYRQVPPAPPCACCACCAADNPAAWGQVPSAKSIYSSSFAWASQLISSPALPADYPLLLVGERAKDQVGCVLFFLMFLFLSL